MTSTRLLPPGPRWLNIQFRPSNLVHFVGPRSAFHASPWRLSSTLTPDPFAAFDRATKSLSLKNLPKMASSSASNTASTSMPLSATTASPGQSAAIEAHPATSAADLHPLPTQLDTSPFPANASAAEGPYDTPLPELEDATINWSQSFSGLSNQPFSKEVSEILMAPLDPDDVEIKPDGVIYLPEIKYRRILNAAFGPGAWGLVPRGSSHVTPRNVSREYALVCLNRLVSLTRGEQDYFNGVDGIPTATEGCKSNALMRCCKDLGVASELWDPNYVNWWKSKFATVEWTGAAGGKKKGLWKKKRSEAWTPRLPPGK